MEQIGIVTLIIYVIGISIGTGLLTVALTLSYHIKLGDSKGKFKDFSGRKLHMLKENYDPGLFDLLNSMLVSSK